MNVWLWRPLKIGQVAELHDDDRGGSHRCLPDRLGAQRLECREMVSLLKSEQGEDDDKESHCVLTLVNIEDEAKMLARLIAGHTERIARNCCPAQRLLSTPRRKWSRSLTSAWRRRLRSWKPAMTTKTSKLLTTLCWSSTLRGHNGPCQHKTYMNQQSCNKIYKKNTTPPRLRRRRRADGCTSIRCVFFFFSKKKMAVSVA